MDRLDYEALWRRACADAMREAALMYPGPSREGRLREIEIARRKYEQMAFPPRWMRR